MRNWTYRWTAACAVATLLFAEAAEPEPYLRTRQQEDGSRALEIAQRELVSPKFPGQTLVLLGVAHIGTEAYYKGAQESLDKADWVLYEGVGGDQVEFRNPDKRPDGMEDGVQKRLADSLGLRFQLNCVRYDRDHYENSDLTPAEMFTLLEGGNLEDLDEAARKELEQLLQTMEGASAQGKIMMAALGIVESNPGLRDGMLNFMVEVMGELTGDMSQYPGLPPKMRRLMEILIQERNQRVIDDVGRTLKEKPDAKRIVVFYGAAHMEDLEMRLGEEYGFKSGDSLWEAAFAADLKKSSLNFVQRNALVWYVSQTKKELRRMTARAKQPTADDQTVEADEKVDAHATEP